MKNEMAGGFDDEVNNKKNGRVIKNKKRLLYSLESKEKDKTVNMVKWREKWRKKRIGYKQRVYIFAFFQNRRNECLINLPLLQLVHCEVDIQKQPLFPWVLLESPWIFFESSELVLMSTTLERHDCGKAQFRQPEFVYMDWPRDSVSVQFWKSLFLSLFVFLLFS